MTLETKGAAINWDGLLNDVSASLSYLRISWGASEALKAPAVHEAMVRDLYAPCLKLLAEFCACVDAEAETHD